MRSKTVRTRLGERVGEEGSRLTLRFLARVPALPILSNERKHLIPEMPMGHTGDIICLHDHM